MKILFFENIVDLGQTHYLQNLTTLWSNYGTYLCNVWSKSIHWFRSYCMRTTFTRFLSVGWTSGFLKVISFVYTC